MRVRDPFEGWDPGAPRGAPRQDSGRGPKGRPASQQPRVDGPSWKGQQMMGRAMVRTGAGLRRVLCNPKEMSGPSRKRPLLPGELLCLARGHKAVK